MKHTCLQVGTKGNKIVTLNHVLNLFHGLFQGLNGCRNKFGMTIGILIVLALFSGCAKPVKVAITPSNLPPIPAKIAIAPLQLSTATLTLPTSGDKEKRMPKNLVKVIAKNIEEHIKGKGVFSEVFSIGEDALPSSPSIPELTQAGREIGADIVLGNYPLRGTNCILNRKEFSNRRSLWDCIITENI